MSPSRRGVPRALRVSLAGNDSTLVAVSLQRQSRLSARIAESSVSTIASSPSVVDIVVAAAVMARRSSVLASRARFHSGDSITISIVGRARGCTARRVRRSFTRDVISFPHLRETPREPKISFPGLAHPRGLGPRLVVGVDDARHELVPNDVVGGVDDVTD